MRILRLTAQDTERARAVFQLMARVFDEPSQPLSDQYLGRLLSRPDFWALAALVDDEPVGGITAHALPMTRAEFSELLVYDIAVRADSRRLGIGRGLVSALRAQAAAEGIRDVIIPADDEDVPALEFYRALGGVPSPVTLFSFSAADGMS